jgi:hypothetical protein
MATGASAPATQEQWAWLASASSRLVRPRQPGRTRCGAADLGSDEVNEQHTELAAPRMVAMGEQGLSEHREVAILLAAI